MRAFFKSLAWLEPLLELVRLGCFLLFLLLLLFYLAGVLRRAPNDVRRRRANLVIVFVLIVTGVVGATQIDAWPFTNWALVHMIRAPAMHSWIVEATDREGRVFEVDKRVFQPMAAEDIATSIVRYERYPPEGKREVLRFLYERAEAGRRRILEGKRFPANDWLLDGASAPYHFEARHLWARAGDVPAGPLASIRLVFIEWNIEERFRQGDSAVARRVVAEYRPDA